MDQIEQSLKRLESALKMLGHLSEYAGFHHPWILEDLNQSLSLIRESLAEIQKIKSSKKGEQE